MRANQEWNTSSPTDVLSLALTRAKRSVPPLLVPPSFAMSFDPSVLPTCLSLLLLRLMPSVQPVSPSTPALIDCLSPRSAPGASVYFRHCRVRLGYAGE